MNPVLLPDSPIPALMYTKPPRGLVGLLLVGWEARGKKLSWSEHFSLKNQSPKNNRTVREDILKTLLNTLPWQGVSQFIDFLSPNTASSLCHAVPSQPWIFMQYCTQQLWKL